MRKRPQNLDLNIKFVSWCVYLIPDTFLDEVTRSIDSEIFKIKSRFLEQNIPLYKLRDFHDKPIVGNFYESELSAVSKSEDALWIIEEKSENAVGGRNRMARKVRRVAEIF